MSGGARGAYPLAIGLVAGHVVEAVVVIGWLARSGLRLRLARPTLDPDSRFVLRQYLPMVGGSLLMVNTQIVDQAMAAMLPAGSLAALSYGTKIMAVPLNIAVTALGTALVPYLSVLVAQRDWGALRHTVAKYLRLSFGAALLPTVVFTFWAEPIVRLFFERGAFGSEDTRVVAGVQALASLQIPFFLAGVPGGPHDLVAVREPDPHLGQRVEPHGERGSQPPFHALAGSGRNRAVDQCHVPRVVRLSLRGLLAGTVSRLMDRGGRVMRGTLVIDGLGPGGARRGPHHHGQLLGLAGSGRDRGLPRRQCAAGVPPAFRDIPGPPGHHSSRPRSAPTPLGEGQAPTRASQGHLRGRGLT